MRILVALVLVGSLSGCSNFYDMAPRSVLKQVGNLSILSAVSIMTTDKTLSDHVLSYVDDKDCSLTRSEQGRSYCKEDEPNIIPVTYCYRNIGEVTCYATPQPSGQLIGNLQ